MLQLFSAFRGEMGVKGGLIDNRKNIAKLNYDHASVSGSSFRMQF